MREEECVKAETLLLKKLYHPWVKVLFCCRKDLMLNHELTKVEKEEEFKCMPDLNQYFPISH